MSADLHFDDDVSQRIWSIYTTPDMQAQRQKVLQDIKLGKGESVLDIGSGPGLLTRKMADIVGSSGRVCGIDVSESMIAISRLHCSDQPWVEFYLEDATKLPFSDNSFDVAVSTQVYEYFSDVETALSELYRVLRPGGRAFILDTDWDSTVWHAKDRRLMKRVLAAWDQHLVDPYLPRTLTKKLRQVGFLVKSREIAPIFNPEYNENTFSCRAIDLIAAFVTGREGITKEDAEAWIMDLRKLGEEGTYFFSLNRYIFFVVKPNTPRGV